MYNKLISPHAIKHNNADFYIAKIDVILAMRNLKNLRKKRNSLKINKAFLELELSENE